MALTFNEFYVPKGSAVADTNGGTMYTGNGQTYTNDGPCVTKPNGSSSGDGLTITNDNEDGWGPAAADDWICFDTSGTKDFAPIASVSGDVITVPAGWGVTTSASGKIVTVGGAWATIQHAADTITTAWAGNFNVPRVNIKYDAAAYAEDVDFDINSGSATVPLIFQGYLTSAGDGCNGGASKPLIEANGAAHTMNNGTVNDLVFIDFKAKYSGSNAQHCIYTNGRRWYFFRVDAELAGSGAGYAVNKIASIHVGCDIKVTGTNGLLVYLLTGVFYKCRFSGGQGATMNAYGGQGAYVDCLWAPNSDGDHLQPRTAHAFGCTFDGATDDNINPSTFGPNVFVNNNISNAGGYGINATAAILGLANTFGAAGEANTSGAETGRYFGIEHDQTADPKYTDSSAEDYTLGSDSPCKADAEPAVIPGSGKTTYADTGCYQREEPAGGGGGMLQANKRANKQ